MAFICPRCTAESHHPDDEKQGYCVRCHWWTGDPQLGDAELLAELEATGVIMPLVTTDRPLTQVEREAAFWGFAILALLLAAVGGGIAWLCGADFVGPRMLFSALIMAAIFFVASASAYGL